MSFDFTDPNTITAVSAAIGAVCGVITSIVALVKNHNTKVLLAKAKERETYTVCPRCKKRVPLSELPFFLPDGSKDNDLNGVPDKEE